MGATFYSHSLLGRLECHAEDLPELTAYTFLRDKGDPDKLTFEALEARVRTIAARLRERLRSGDRALLLYPQGLEFLCAFLGCLAAGAIAVPAYPRRGRRKSERLNRIIADCKPTVALTVAPLRSAIPAERGDALVIATDEWPTTDAPPWGRDVHAETVAFLQYTSGSTGDPKGVMVTHGNIACNQRQIQQAFGHTPWKAGSPATIAVSWLPLFHDMGLIGGALQPLYVGFPAVLLSATTFLQQPVKWLQAISDYRGTTAGGPNFAYEHCVRSVSENEKDGLDLSSLKTLFNGAEPVRGDTLDRFAAAFGKCGFDSRRFFPCYGLAEATLLVSGGSLEREPSRIWVDGAALEQGRIEHVAANSAGARCLIGCGKPASGVEAVVVDPTTRLAAIAGRVGEIWIRSDCVAAGYWNGEGDTQSTFGNRLADSADGPYLATGDLGFLDAGELYISGRLKDVIIFRGRNIYPHDIEAAISDETAAVKINCCGAFAIDTKATEGIAIVAGVDFAAAQTAGAASNGDKHGPAAREDLDSLVARIRRRVSEDFEAPVHTVVLVRPGSFPRTSSGKVQRAACRDALLENKLDVIHAWSIDARRPAEIRDSQPPLGSADQVSSQRKADEIIGWLRDYAARKLNSRLIDERRCVPPYVVLDFGLHGLFGLQAPAHRGGAELTTVDFLRVVEQLAAIDLTLCLMVGIHNGLGLRPLQRFGCSAEVGKLLPLLASGRQLAAFALTESAAGSNPNGIQTTARREGDAWIVRGEKRWIGLASWAGVITTFAKAVDETGCSTGMVALAIRDDSRGVRHGPESPTMGARGIVQNRVYFHDVRVPDAFRLGEIGDGMTVAQDAMMFCRMGLAAVSVGAMKRCAQLAARYSERRVISTGRLFDNPLALHRVENIVAAARATEALAGSVARWIDAGEDVPTEAYVACKTTGPELLGQSVDWLVQLLGGRGYEENSPAPQLFRDARLLRIFEGPTETLNAFLGSSVLQDGRRVGDLLAKRFGQSDLAAGLEAAAAELKSRGRPHAQANAHLTGELASAAVLAAAAKQRSSTGECPAEAARWAQQRFETVRDSILKAAARAIPTPSALLHEVADFARSIGDVEQTLPRDEEQLDPLLCVGATPNHYQAIRGQNADARGDSPERQQADRFDEPIRVALRRWLQKEMGPLPEDFADDTTFTSLGLDSIGAATVALDIEKATGVRVSPDTLYQYPTIAALAAHLARKGAPAPFLAASNGRCDARTGSQTRGSGPGPLEGSANDFASPTGADLPDRVACYEAWRRSRDDTGVWQYGRVVKSPAAPAAHVNDFDGMVRQSINFGSQDYLGLARDPRILEAAKAAVDKFGVHSAGSPVLLGTTVPMVELESTLARTLGKDDCLIFPTGWAAGFGVVAGLVREYDTLVVDALCHRSLLEGVRHVTKAPIFYRHNDLEHLREICAAARERDTTNGLFVVAESLYSMDSDSPELRRLAAIVREFGGVLILDVAHDFGSMGQRGLGLLEELDGSEHAVDVLMGSFSKTFAATGGFIAADRAVANFLRGHTTSFVFSNAISPVQAAVALACCHIAFSAEGELLRERLLENVLALRGAMESAGFRVGGVPSPIVPVFVGTEREARLTARQIAKNGLLANLVEYPAVPRGTARFRFQVMSSHSPEMAREAAGAFRRSHREAVGTLRGSFLDTSDATCGPHTEAKTA